MVDRPVLSIFQGLGGPRGSSASTTPACCCCPYGCRPGAGGAAAPGEPAVGEYADVTIGALGSRFGGGPKEDGSRSSEMGRETWLSVLEVSPPPRPRRPDCKKE